MKAHPLLLFSLCLSAVGLQAESEPVSFSRDIQPLFAETCLECHGADKQKGKLRMDKEGDVHRTIEEDELLYRLTTDDPDDRMPPEGDRLLPEQIEKVKTWIAAGAKFEKHWAYRPLQKGPPPSVKNADWVRNPIDQFILARLEKENLAPSPEADRFTLLKRLHYDLLGLPPSPSELKAFLNDSSPDAYEKLVQKLLASEHFGERWGRHWLDKARYADSDGYEKDRNRPHAWHYRDWVIDAVNADMAMDQFTVEQLAGDLLPDPDNNQNLATAFHRQTLTNTEGGTDKEEFRVEAVFDRTETTATIWLGLTMNCARCHSHKYDAIEQSEYYQLYAFFNNGDETSFHLPKSEEAMEKYRQAKRNHDKKVQALEAKIAAAKEGLEQIFTAWENDLTAHLAKDNSQEFHVLREVTASADVDGIQFETDEEGVIQVSGANPDGITVTTVAVKPGSIAEPVTGIRLDVLPDPRLPQNGPGRAPNGNFVLNEVELFLGDKKSKFKNATADFSQDRFPAKNLIDGSAAKMSGWAVGSQVGRKHQVDLSLQDPIQLSESTSVTIKLTRNYDGGHSLGRFQIRLMTGETRQIVPPQEIQAILTAAPEKRSEKQEKQLYDYFLEIEHEPTRSLLAEMKALEKQAPKEPVTPIRIISQRGEERETRVLDRGSFLSPLDQIQPAGLSVLPPIPNRENQETLTRLDLANWLMSEQNPLPPRVLANHVWEKLFGDGLVRTLNDFGVRGELPDYPHLLDWLGNEYRRLGWSRKRLIETIVLSSTYRQASAHREDLQDLDPNNHLLARQNRFRVQAETVRDVSLSVAGLLSDKVGGPSVYPPMPPEVALLSYNNNFKWATSQGDDRYRRGMYTFFKRTSPHPNLIAFDCPDSNTTNVKRRTSNTPIQALTMLNNEVYVEAAQAFAARILKLDAKEDRDRMAQALQLAIVRPPGDGEIQKFLNLLDQGRGFYLSNPDSAKEMTTLHRPAEIAEGEAAAWVSVARIILNLDELITRE